MHPDHNKYNLSIQENYCMFDSNCIKIYNLNTLIKNRDESLP